MKMNDRQKAFAEYFAACGNAAEAARRAGYAESSARQQGERLLTNADIAKYISELTGRLADERIADAVEVRQYWTKVLRSGDEKTSDRLRAGAQLLRAAGPMSPAPSKDKDTDLTAQMEKEEVIIALPYGGGDPDEINAFQRPDGEITPFAGSEDEDVLIYIPVTGWREEDHNADQ